MTGQVGRRVDRDALSALQGHKIRSAHRELVRVTRADGSDPERRSADETSSFQENSFKLPNRICTASNCRCSGDIRKFTPDISGSRRRDSFWPGFFLTFSAWGGSTTG